MKSLTPKQLHKKAMKFYGNALKSVSVNDINEALNYELQAIEELEKYSKETNEKCGHTFQILYYSASTIALFGSYHGLQNGLNLAKDLIQKGLNYYFEPLTYSKMIEQKEIIDQLILKYE